MLKFKAATITAILLAECKTIDAILRGRRLVDPTDELHVAMQATRLLKGDGGFTPKNFKGNKQTGAPSTNPSSNPSVAPTSSPTSSPTSAPTASTRIPTSTPTSAPTSPPTGAPTSRPTGQPVASATSNPTSSPTNKPTSRPTSRPTSMPTSGPTSAPTTISFAFDSSISVACEPDVVPPCFPPEAFEPKTIICNPSKTSCREAVAAVRSTPGLQNYFACAGLLTEGDARKLFNRYASNPMLAEELTLLSAAGTTLLTALSGYDIYDACQNAGAPCCAEDYHCTSADGYGFMTIATTACVGPGACAEMGLNPLVLDSSCTSAGACAGVNSLYVSYCYGPHPTYGVTFIGQLACTDPISCTLVGDYSYGDVIIQSGACVGPYACSGVGYRGEQYGPSRSQSHVRIGSNACRGEYACTAAHASGYYDCTCTSLPSPAKIQGSLSIGDNACTADYACAGLGFGDSVTTDIIVPDYGCDSDYSCEECMTETNCNSNEVFIIYDAAAACPKDSCGYATGELVDQFCINKDQLPTDCPTFAPTPLASDTPTTIPTEQPSDLPTSVPTSPPTINKTILRTLCLNEAGEVAAGFTSGPVVLCDDDVGTCTQFVQDIESLPSNKDRFVKSIFGCDDDQGSQASQQQAQVRFDRIKNDPQAIAAIFTALEGDGILLTANAASLSTQCSAVGGTCCQGTLGCTLGSDIITITPDSCATDNSCEGVSKDTIILGSCLGPSSCKNLRSFSNPPGATAIIGYQIIGPAACTNTNSCENLGQNIYGNIRIQGGGCNGVDGCKDLGIRAAQSASIATPTLANIDVGKNACQGQRSCQNVHAGLGKTIGSITIGSGACLSRDSCNGVANANSAVDDLVITANTCAPANSCKDCVATDMCSGPSGQTYTIDSPSNDCPGRNDDACS